MRITRKPWIKTLRQLVKLFTSAKTMVFMEEDGLHVYEPHMQVFMPYPDAARFPVGAIGLIDLFRALTPLTESAVHVFSEKEALKLQEECVTIKVPHDPKAMAISFFMETDAAVTHKSNVKELPSALLALRAAIGGAKSSGIADYIYWEGSRLYSYNGTMLGVAEFHKCPVPRIFIPKVIADFVTGLEMEEPVCTVQVYADKSVSLDFKNLGCVRFTQPDQEPINWTELMPKEPERWFPVPALFFRLPQVVLSLADRHHAKIKLTWQNKKLIAEGTDEHALQFSLDEDIGIIGTKSGMLDILALNPILSYAQRMGWGKDCLIFSSHMYRFYCSLEPVV